MLLICDALGLESHQKDDLFAALDSVITDEQHQELQSRRISPLLPPSVKALVRVGAVELCARKPKKGDEPVGGCGRGGVGRGWSPS